MSTFSFADSIPFDDVFVQSNTSRRPRVWWCPTGPLVFLPIHAAGIYSPEITHAGPCVSDYVISSYTPTISALITRVKLIESRNQAPAQLLLISQPSTPNLTPIDATRTETRNLSNIMGSKGVKSLWLDDVAATTTRVAEVMNAYSWVHFACHATQDTKDPLKSGVHLYDGPLELSAMIKQRSSIADHAFMSACQTSTGNEELPDEAVHIAAGMLAVGYRSVVATMWSISDAHGPAIAEEFYQYILSASSEEGGENRLDSSHAAHALDASIQKIRNQLGDTERALLTWIPYVHFGI